MGAWGVGLYDDDIACDVRQTFPERLGSGESVEQATMAMAVAYGTSLESPTSDPVFWLALADVQWKLGRLLPEVKAAAEAVVSADLQRWSESPAQMRKRTKVIEKLVAKLAETQPAPKPIKAVPWVESPFQLGELVAFVTPSGCRVLMHVLEATGGRGSATTLFRFLAASDHEALTTDVAAQLPEVTLPPDKSSRVLVLTTSDKSVPRKRLEPTGITFTLPTDFRAFTLCTWRELAEYVDRWFGAA